jgi:hypothetical protein
VVDAIDEHLRHGNTTLHEFRVLREIAGISRLSGFLELSGKESSELQNIEKEFPIVLLLRCLQVRPSFVFQHTAKKKLAEGGVAHRCIDFFISLYTVEGVVTRI